MTQGPSSFTDKEELLVSNRKQSPADNRELAHLLDLVANDKNIVDISNVIGIAAQAGVGATVRDLYDIANTMVPLDDESDPEANWKMFQAGYEFAGRLLASSRGSA